MSGQESPQRSADKVPPAWLVRLVTRFRDFLEKVRRKTAPPHVALLELSLSFWYTQAIYVAAKLGVADHLKDGPKSIDELAEATGTDAGALYRLMRALASIGVFAEENDGRFALTRMGEALRSDAPNSMRAVAIMTGEDWWWNAWGRIDYGVRTGRSSFEHVHGMRFFEYMRKNPEAGAVFDKAMRAYTAQTATEVVKAYRFPETGVVVDVGGGHGALMVAILRRHPNLRGIIFDLPGTAEEAKSLLESHGLSNRCQVVGGDFFEAIPGGGDVYVLQHVLHDWDDKNAARILENCRRAMAGNGKLVLVEMVIPLGNGPFLGKFLDLGVLMMESGARERTETEYRKLLSGARFELSRVIGLASPDSVIEAVRRG